MWDSGVPFGEVNYKVARENEKMHPYVYLVPINILLSVTKFYRMFLADFLPVPRCFFKILLDKSLAGIL